MTKKSSNKGESVGWLFWGISFGVLLVPCLYALSRVTTEQGGVAAIVGFGTGLAALGAGIISWTVNAVLQSRAQRLRRAARKKGKSRKRA